MEVEKCLEQSEKISSEKIEFESALYTKVCSLNLLLFRVNCAF